MKAILISALTFIFASPVLADYKISQKSTVEGVSSTVTTYAKGVRQRRESKIEMDDPEAAAMMERMMPGRTELYQCDLKQNVTISEAKKVYFIDYYDWTGLSPEQKKRLPNQKMVVKGTSMLSAIVTDSGKRQQMFGMTARWLKFVQTIENSADSCEGKASVRMEQEGWFVDLMLSSDSCQVPQTPGSKGGCRPKLILNGMQNPGFFLQGTTKMYENNKLGGTFNIETIALSKATLDQALFEIPKDFREVESEYELTKAGDVDMSASTINEGTRGTKVAGKTIAIDFFSGSVSKVNQDELRGYISQKLSGAGFNGFPINSQAELATGNFVNVIGIELKKVKESGASKIGGLFGKVTGSDDAAKIGDSEAEIVVTVFGKDGKTAVASSPASAKVKGKPNDAVKAAIDQVLSGLLARIK
ncbi:MAG TPA: hypothetical protein VJL58_08825 [Pyrinomonadaceae bacterium]|nr:hypothetical protein [Pyrinomonadaceae bacterium]